MQGPAERGRDPGARPVPQQGPPAETDAPAQAQADKAETPGRGDREGRVYAGDPQGCG